MKSKILSFGYQINIKDFEDEKVYEYIPNKNIAEEFLMCDLFIHSPYLRKHTKMINKKQFLFKYETDKLLSSLQVCDENRLIKIARQLVEAICVLHQHNIPGRCFNINNILWNEKTEKITLMEFGLSSPLIISPPELLNQKYRCYGIEIDQFLIGCILYELHFKKPLKLDEHNLFICFSNLTMELNTLNSGFLKEILVGLLQFNLSNRIHFRDLAKLLGCHQEIQNFCSCSKNYKIKQNMIDQKIFFRESRQDKSSTYIIAETALIESLIYQPTYFAETSDSLQSPSLENQQKTNKKIRIIENTLMQDVKNLEFSKFQCFHDVIITLKELDSSEAPELCLTILAINFGIIYFYLQLIKELENENSTFFATNEQEVMQWRSYKNINQESLKDDVAKLKKKLNSFRVSFDRQNELSQVQKQIIQNQHDNQEFLNKQLRNFISFNNTLEFQETSAKFLDVYRIQCLYMLITVNENLEFTTTVAKAMKLRQNLLLCAFADILFKPQLNSHIVVCEILKIKKITFYEQFEESLKKDNSSQKWFKNTIDFLLNHEIGRNYSQYLKQLI